MDDSSGGGKPREKRTGHSAHCDSQPKGQLRRKGNQPATTDSNKTRPRWQSHRTPQWQRLPWQNQTADAPREANVSEPPRKPAMLTGRRGTILAMAETQGEEDRPLGTLCHSTQRVTSKMKDPGHRQQRISSRPVLAGRRTEHHKDSES